MKEVKNPKEIKKLMKSNEPVAIFYYASWCPHCKVMHEPWNELEKEDGGKTKFVKMESEDIPPELGIQGYPHFVMVKGGKVVASTGGEMSKEDLKSKLMGGQYLAYANGRKKTLRRRRRTLKRKAY
jgi:thioredoxin 1